MVRPRSRGFTLLEVVYVLAIFGVFLFILTTMLSELQRQDKRYPINFMSHPQVIAVTSRLRRDVLDALGKSPYPYSFQTYSQGDKLLIIDSLSNSGFAYVVVWDFRKRGEARRLAYSAGSLSTEWVARGVPEMTISTFEIPDRPYSVRIRARDDKGKLAIDQIFQPRTHE